MSAGTFFGALIAGDLADWFGRRWTIISGCGIFIIGCVLQVASTDGLGLVSQPLLLSVSSIVAGHKNLQKRDRRLHVTRLSLVDWSLVLVWDSSRRSSFFTCPKSLLEKSEVLSSLATNSASLSVSCWHHVFVTPPRTETTPDRTEFPLPFNSSGRESPLAIVLQKKGR